MRQEEVLTRTQDRRFKTKVLTALKKLATAPQVRDMIRKVELGHYPRGDWMGKRGKLLLTKKGLMEQTGYYDKCLLPSDCSGDHDSYWREPKVVKPSMRLVEEYGLREEPINQLLARLK